MRLEKIPLAVHTLSMVAGLLVLSLSLSGQTLIENWYDLDSVRYDLNGSYKLAKTLDSTTKGYQQVASASANGGKGFNPIDSTYTRNGNQVHVPFSGNFDGNEHTIRHLHIDRPSRTHVGLFGSIRWATIKDLGIEKATVKGHDDVGMMVGQVGYPGALLSFSDLRRCYTNGQVTAKGTKAGGLIGEIAVNTTDVRRCYSHADVSGTDLVGGLVGAMPSGSVTLFWIYQPSIFRSYATGAITSTGSLSGGLIGYIEPSWFLNFIGVTTLFESNFWDQQTTGQQGNGAGNLIVSIQRLTGLQSGSMKSLTSFAKAGWQIAKAANFNQGFDHWKIVNGKTYPSLGWERIAYRTVPTGPNKWSNVSRWQIFNNRSQWLPATTFPDKDQKQARIIVRHDMVIEAQTKVALSGILELRDGIINNKSLLTLRPTSKIKGGSSDSYIAGTLKRQGTGKQYFPVGSSGRFAPLSLIISPQYWWLWPSAKVSYKQQPYHSGSIKSSSPLDVVSQQEHWQADVQNGNADATLFWKDAGFSGIQQTQDLRVARWNGSQWEVAGRDTLVANGNQGRIRVNQLQDLGRLTFGSTNAQSNPLPVELAFFRAKAQRRSVKLHWQTASETNNSHFLLQKRTNASGWQRTDSLHGHGTSLQPHNYRTVDSNPSAGANYYRLKQVDRDGTFEMHGIEVVRVEAPAFDKLALQLKSGSASQKSIRIGIKSPREQALTYQFFSLQGHLLKQGKWQVQSGHQNRNLRLTYVPHGTYYLRVEGASRSISRKLVH